MDHCFLSAQLIQTVIVQMANPIATAIYGKGDIKGYAIWKSIMNIMPIILSIIAFSSEGSPIWLYLSLIMFMGLGGDIVILYYGKLKCKYISKIISSECLFPVLGISAVMIAFELYLITSFHTKTYFLQLSVAL